MRKSIKRIVSSVLVATMVLTSCVVSNVSMVSAAGVPQSGTQNGQSGIPCEVDASEYKLKLDGDYSGVVTVDMDIALTKLKKGSLFRLRSSDGMDHEAAVRCTDSATGAAVLGKADDGTPGFTLVNGDNKISVTLDTATGAISCTVNDVTLERTNDSSYLGKDISEIKFGNGFGATIKSVTVDVGGSVEPTPEETTASVVEPGGEETTAAAPSTGGSTTYEQSGTQNGQSGIPCEVDASEYKLKLDSDYSGEVTVDMDINLTKLKKGSLFRLRSSDGMDHEAAVRCTDSATGAAVLGKADDGTPGFTLVNGDNKFSVKLNTATGDITCTVNGVTVSRTNDPAYLGKDISEIKFGNGFGATINKVTVTVAGGAVEEPSTETSTAAVVEPPSETPSEDAPAPAEAGKAKIYPVIVNETDTDVEIAYMVDLGEGAGFNNYTLFLNFDPAKLTPVDAVDGDITTDGKDATGAAVKFPASNAANIKAQFAAVPAAGNSDFTNADGTTPQKGLGRIKIAFCISDEAFDAIGAGTLPAYKTDGTLFTIKFSKASASVNGAVVSLDCGTFNVVTKDKVETPELTPTEVGTGSVVLDADKGDISGNTETLKVSEAKAGKDVDLTFTYNGDTPLYNIDALIKFNNDKITLKSVEIPKLQSAYNEPGSGRTAEDQKSYAPADKDPDYQNGEDYHVFGIAPDDANAINKGDTVAKITVTYLDAAAKAGDTENIDFILKEDAAGGKDGEIIAVTATPAVIKIVDDSEQPSESQSESVSEPQSESVSESASESQSQQASETPSQDESQAQPTTSTPVTEAPSQTTTSGGGSNSGPGGGGGRGPQKTTATTTTEEAVEATTSSRPSVDVSDGIGFKPPVDKIPNFTGFDDLGNYPWAEGAINKLAELGIISGIADRTYGPALPCRRCDFAILINRTLGVTVNSTPKNFYDNEETSKYYYNDVLVGYNAGILSGYGNNYYKPEQYCTREEMAVLVAKSYEWLGLDVTSTDLSVNNKYTDVANISWWSAPYVAYLTDQGVLNGNTDGTLLPQNFINRAEMAVMMSKVYDDALDMYNDKVAEAEAAKAEKEAATEATTETAETTTAAE